MKSKETVVLGLSGGVDSSVAGLLLKKKGYNVIGVFLKLYSDTKHPLTGECAYLEDLKMAKKIALLLDIKLYVLDFEKEYKKLVLEPMFEKYRKGKTPNPDILCNKLMKFPLLIKSAGKYNADFIATGHYARIKKTSKGIQLFTGKDKTKDQSYFLADLSIKELKKAIFPLGELTKKEVREIAKENGFPNWNKHGTTGICFVGQDNMQELLRENIKVKMGEVFDDTGRKIGIHQGVAYYTIGQKALPSIGIEIKKPSGFEQQRLYVAQKDLKRNKLIVTSEESLLLKKKEIRLKNLHFINKERMILSGLKARLRHLGQYYNGKIIKSKNNYSFVFNRPVSSIASGQIAVFYLGEHVAGCGEIV